MTYACFRSLPDSKESWWEIIDLTSHRARQVWHTDPSLIGRVTNIRYADPDCEHHEELPDHVVVDIAKRALLRS